MASWVVDTDGGIDDGQALVIALRHPHVFNLAAITVVAGNVTLETASQNVAECLRVCGREEVPYFKGAGKPIIGPPVRAEYYHGEDGFNGYWARTHGDTLPPLKQAEQLHAASAIIELANQLRPLNILTIGPLTNLALALMLDPELPSKLGRVVVMGASVHAKGNITHSAEYNIYGDPEASYIVFENLNMIELISWETSVEHPLDPFFEAYLASSSDHGCLINLISRNIEGVTTSVSPDGLAVCVAIDPSIVLKSTKKKCRVELTGALTRGMVAVSWSPFVKETSPPNASIIEQLDMTKVKQLFLDSVS
jgi:purine nucleosidase